MNDILMLYLSTGLLIGRAVVYVLSTQYRLAHYLDPYLGILDTVAASTG